MYVPELPYLARWFFPPIETSDVRCDHITRNGTRNTARDHRVRDSDLLGRMRLNMQETQVKERPESQATETSVQGSAQSRFNNAEYERWSEKLRNRNRSKDK
jgi:hypothetical protein